MTTDRSPGLPAQYATYEASRLAGIVREYGADSHAGAVALRELELRAMSLER